MHARSTAFSAASHPQGACGLERPEQRQGELAQRVSRHATADGVHETAIDGLALVRASAPSQPLPAVYDPSLCIVVQGRKIALVGEESYLYDPLNYLVVSVSLPVIGQIVDATPARPYLCLRIGVDAQMVAELLLETRFAVAQKSHVERGLYVARANAALLDAVLRLVRLLDHPADAAVLAPLAMREIHYRALAGELGERLRRLCIADGPTQRIARAIELLRRRYADALRIDDLAASAHMSASSFHHHFKAVTAMSPMQFQKHMRLHEARRLMLLEGLEASSAAHRVGYESPSQFSREYRRLFGSPPRREIQDVRLKSDSRAQGSL